MDYKKSGHALVGFLFKTWKSILELNKINLNI